MRFRPLLEFYTSYRGNVSAILRCGGCGCPHVGLTFAHGQLHSRRTSRGCVLWSYSVFPKLNSLPVLSQLLTVSPQWPKAKDANVTTQPY